MKTRHYTEHNFLDGPEKRNHLDGSLASAFIEPKWQQSGSHCPTEKTDEDKQVINKRSL